MPQYRAYIIGSDGEFQNSVSLECADDAVAREKANQLVDGHHVELWQLTRKIATFVHKPHAHVPGITEFVQWQTGTHQCGCGARYIVTVTEVPTGSVTCEKCETLMDSRANRSFFAYARIMGDA